jgi:hypothetical protein
MRLVYYKVGSDFHMKELKSDDQLEQMFGTGIIKLGSKSNWTAYITKTRDILFETEVTLNPFQSYTKRGKLQRLFLPHFNYKLLYVFIRDFLVDRESEYLRIIDRVGERGVFLRLQSEQFLPSLLNTIFVGCDNMSDIACYTAGNANVLWLQRVDGREFILTSQKSIFPKGFVEYVRSRLHLVRK